MAARSVDRNLLFGILALQMDFVSRQALIEGMQAWLLEKQKSLGELLVERGAMTAGNVSLLEPLVDAHVGQHGGEVQQSLAAVSSDAGLVASLAQVEDSDLQASLSLLPQPEPFIEVEAGFPSTAAPPDDSSDVLAPVHDFGETALPDADAGGAHTLDEPEALKQRYRILRPHAEGGLGRVHVALDQELHREVAFKDIKPQHARRRDAQSRFVVEAEITGGLEHPGIVPVYGLGHYPDGRPFYAMRFIRGQSLHDAIRSFHATDDIEVVASALPFRNLINRLIDVCNAIEYAHSRKVLHRDLKPGNIMLGRYGETLVVDWGLAKPTGAAAPTERTSDDDLPIIPASGSQSAPTLAGQAVGTPSYMPPEQAAGRHDQLGPASDVYSLGATLYEVVTGQPPLKGLKLTELLARVKEGDIPAPRRVNPHIPAALDAICRTAMARKPVDRYASARDLATDLESWLADEPVSAFSEPLARRARRWVRRHPVVVSTTAACVLMALVGLSAVSAVVTRSNEQLAEKNTTLDTVNQELNSTNEALKTSNDKERKSRELAEAAQARAEQDRVAARLAAQQALEATEKATTAAALAKAKTNEARQKLVDQFIGRGALELDSGRIQQAAIFLAAASIERDNLPEGMRDAGGGTQLELLLEQSLRQLESRQGELAGHTAAIQSVRFSDDGQWLVTASSDQTCKLWNWHGGRILEQSFDDHTDTVTDAFFLEDDRIVTASLDSAARVRDFRAQDADDRNRSFGEHLSGITTTDVIGDGRVLTGCGRGDIYLWPVDDGEPVLLKDHDSGLRHIASGPAGDYALSVDEDGNCRLWNLTDQSALDLTQEPDFSALYATFNSLGDVVIVTGRSGEVAFRDVSTSELIGIHAGHRGACTRIVVQPGSTRVASLGEDGQVVVWDSATGDVVQRIQLPEAAGGARDAAFHNDGELLLTVDDAGYLRVWDTRDARLRQEFRAHSVVSSVIATHPDGRHVVTAGIDGSLRAWRIQQHFAATVLASDDGVTWSEFSQDGKQFVSSHESGNVRIYDANTLQLRQELVHSADDWVKQAHFSPGDGSQLLTLGGKTARLFDLASGNAIWSLPELDDELVVSAAQFASHKDAFVVAVRRRSPRKEFHENAGWSLWDVSSNRDEAIRSGTVGGIRQLRLSPDQRVLVALHAPGNGTIWRLDSGDRNGSVPGATCAIFPSSGQAVWGVHDGTLRLTRYDTAFEITRSDGSDGSAICATAELNSGQQVVTGANNGQISIRDRESCALIRHMEPLSGDGGQYIVALATSPDSSLIAAGSDGGTVGLWEPQSGKLVGQWFTDDSVSAVSFSPSGSSLLFSTRGGTLRHVQIPRPDATGQHVAARVWQLTRFEGGTGDRQYQEAVASLEQAIATEFAGKEESLAGFQDRNLREVTETIRSSVAREQYGIAAGHIRQVLSRPDTGSDESVELRFLLARTHEKFSGLRHTVHAHDGFIHEIRLAPDESSFLTIGFDRSARLWSLPDGRLIHDLQHKSIVWDGQFSPDGNLAAICGFDNAAYLWNTQTGQIQHVLSGHQNRIGDIRFGPEGKRLITGSRDHTAMLWDSQSGQSITSLEGHAGYVVHARIDPTGQFAITAAQDDPWPRVWDADTGELITELELTDSRDAELRVNAVRISGSGNRVAFACNDGTVRLWDPESEMVTSFSGDDATVWNAALSPDASVCVSTGQDGTARVWDLTAESPTETQVLRHPVADAVKGLRFLPDVSRAVTSCGRDVRVWDVRDGRLLAAFTGHDRLPVELAATANAETIITGSGSGVLRIWSVTDATPPVAPVKLPQRITHSVPTGRDRILIVDEAGEVALVNVQSGEVLSTAKHESTGLTGFTWFTAGSPGDWYAGSTAEGQLLLGGYTSDEVGEARVISGEGAFVGRVTVSGDRRRLAAQVDQGRIVVWDAETGDELTAWDSLHGDISALTLANDGGRLASAGDGVARLWNTENGMLEAEFDGHSQVIEAIAFLADGKRIATGSRDHSARVWSVDTQKVEHLLYGHTAAVNRIVSDESGRHVLTLSIDGSAMVWDSTTGRRVCRLQSNRESILQAEFLHGAAMVLTATSTGAVRVWSTRTGEVIYNYAENNPSTWTCHVLPGDDTGANNLLAVSRTGFIQYWSTDAEGRAMDDPDLARSIERMADHNAASE